MEAQHVMEKDKGGQGKPVRMDTGFEDGRSSDKVVLMKGVPRGTTKTSEDPNGPQVL